MELGFSNKKKESCIGKGKGGKYTLSCVHSQCVCVCVCGVGLELVGTGFIEHVIKVAAGQSEGGGGRRGKLG